MSLKDAALTLNEFYKIVHQLPEGLLKAELESHVQEMVACMLKNCVLRNQKRNFFLKMQQYKERSHHLTAHWSKLFHAKSAHYS